MALDVEQDIKDEILHLAMKISNYKDHTFGVLIYVVLNVDNH